MTKDEALKLALGALEANDGWGSSIREAKDRAITAIKEALANVATEDTSKERVDEMQKQRHEQEPVAWMDADGKTFPFVWNVSSLGVRQGSKYLDESLTPLYTTPPQRTWVGLTEDERDHLEGLHLYAVRGQVEAWIEGVDDFAQAIEAKLKQKNGYAEENT